MSETMTWMAEETKITIPEKPLSVNRAYEIVQPKGKNYSTMMATQDMKTYKEKIGYEVKQYVYYPLTGPIILYVTFVFDRAHRSNEELEGLPHPDVDGPLKPTLDALEGILFRDDSQIQRLHVRKEYDPDVPRIELIVKEE